MYLLGTAGGVGPAMDVLCCCPTLLAVTGTFAAAAVGLLAGSTRAVAVGWLLAVLAGAVVVVIGRHG